MNTKMSALTFCDKYPTENLPQAPEFTKLSGVL